MGVATLMGTPARGPRQRGGPREYLHFRVVPADQLSMDGGEFPTRPVPEDEGGEATGPAAEPSQYKPWLGASVQKLDAELAETMGIQGRGLLVAGVKEGGAAAEGGLRREDVITGANGAPVYEVDELKTILREVPPGGSVTLQVKDGESGEDKDIVIERRTGTP